MGMDPPTPEQYDVLLIYDENDRPVEDDSDNESSDSAESNGMRKIDAVKGVNNLTKILKTHIKINNEDDDKAPRSPKVARLHIDLVGKGTLNHQLKEGIERSTYLFFYLSPSFSDAERAKTVKEIQKMKDDALHETMNEKSKENCAIPLYTLSRKESRENKFSVPFGLRSIRGIDISCMIKSGTPLDCVGDADCLEINNINPDVIEKLEKLLNRRAGDIKGREVKEIQELTIEGMEEDNKVLTEQLEYKRKESGLSKENGQLRMELEQEKNKETESEAMASSSECEEAVDYEDYKVGKMASGRKVSQESGQASPSDVQLSDGGCPVAAVSDNQGRSLIDEPSEMSLNSFPPVAFPPSSPNAVTTVPQLVSTESDFPELNLSEHELPSNHTGAQSDQGSDQPPRSIFDPLPSLSGIFNDERSVQLSPESPSSSFMDLQEIEFIPGINMYTIRLTSDGITKLLKKINRGRNQNN